VCAATARRAPLCFATTAHPYAAAPRAPAPARATANVGEEGEKNVEVKHFQNIGSTFFKILI